MERDKVQEKESEVTREKDMWNLPIKDLKDRDRDVRTLHIGEDLFDAITIEISTADLRGSLMGSLMGLVSQ